MTDPSKTPNPKEALKPFANMFPDNLPLTDPLGKKLQSWAKAARAAIPVAELEGQAMKLLEERETRMTMMQHEGWMKRRNHILTQLETLKCNPQK